MWRSKKNKEKDMSAAEQQTSEDKALEEMRERVEQIKKTEAPAKPEVSLQDQMTFWNYLNDTQIGSFDPSKLEKANTWLVTRRGTWLIQKNNSGYYGIKKSKEGIKTLPECPDYPQAFFDLKYGKIPNEILLQILSFFREIMKRHNDAEAFIQIYWDKQEEKYIIHVPKQQISKASVKYDATENLNVVDSDRYVFVYECHSHNSMGAFWSGTDNRDEKELRVYGVFGKLDQEEYACKHRFFVGEEQVDLDISLVFDIPKEEDKKYLVTHNNKQYMVNGNELKLDNKPKYVYENQNGEKLYIPLESVVVQKPTADVPDTWYSSINVPFTTYNKAPANLPKGPTSESYGRTSIGDFPQSRYSKTAWRDKVSDPFYSSDQVPGLVDDEDIDYGWEEIASDISTIVEEVMDKTNGFQDDETSQMFFNLLDNNGGLTSMSEALQTFFYNGADVGGPSDGKYSNYY